MTEPVNSSPSTAPWTNKVSIFIVKIIILLEPKASIDRIRNLKYHN
ncbi:hypothetical protein [Clostridium butyricum]|nr:hypothetical protein [Clostridium butyricum]